MSALKCLDVNYFGSGAWNLPEVIGRFMAGMPVAAAVCLSCLTGIKQTVHEAYVGLQGPHTCGTSDGSSDVMKLRDARENARQPMHTGTSHDDVITQFYALKATPKCSASSPVNSLSPLLLNRYFFMQNPNPD
jgi:hypothetical protein